MKLINKSDYSDDFIEVLIRFCLPPNLTLDQINEVKFIKNNKDFNILGEAMWLTNDIRLLIGKKELKYPHVTSYEVDNTKLNYLLKEDENKFPKYVVQNEIENLVSYLAHEMKHIEQYYNKPNSKTNLNLINNFLLELDAEKYSAKKVKEWRKNSKLLLGE